MLDESKTIQEIYDNYHRLTIYDYYLLSFS